MTRVEHLEFCKRRALEYLDRGDLAQAIASMLSDLNQHSETRKAGEAAGPAGLFFAMQGDVTAVRRFINGFN